MIEEVDPKIVAIISAVLQTFGNRKILAIKIERNENWTLASRNRN